MPTEAERGSPGPVTQELLDRARAHDREALSILYETSSLELYRTIRALVRDEDLAMDIHQDSYIQAFSHLDQLREAGRFLPWLRQIAVNEARGQLRKKRPALFTELSPEADGPELALPDPRPEVSPELSLERKENARLVREILDGLSDGQRLILGMYYYEEIPIRQIAEDTGLSPGTVKAQLSRGRARVEKEVRRLEAQGVKLYGLSPLPFLLALLRKAEPAAEAGEGFLARRLPRGLEQAGVHVGRGFFQTALGRVSLGILAAAVMGGGILTGGWVRERLRIGDYQPPAFPETEENLRLSSPEDLTTEPLSSETPEPVPPTEPVETEAATLSPETEPSESAAPGVPPPGTPTQPAPKPDNPAPQPTEPEGAFWLEWAWDTGTQMDWTVEADETGFGSPRTLTAVLPLGQAPELYPEDEGVVSIRRVRYDGSLDRISLPDSRDWVSRYQWSVIPMGEGSTRVHCAVDGRVIQTLTVTVRVPVKLLDSGVVEAAPFYSATELTLANCAVGMRYQLRAAVLGEEAPVFSTDNESVLRLEGVSWEPLGALSRQYLLSFQIVGPGDAQLRLSLGGEPEQTWSVHAVSAAVDLSDSQEDLLSWQVNSSSRPLLILPGGMESLYIKVKGTEAPEITQDNPAVISLSPVRSDWHEERNETEFWYRLSALGSGVCTLRCVLGGRQIFLLPIVVP